MPSSDAVAEVVSPAAPRAASAARSRIPPPEVLLRVAHAGIGLADAPEVLPGGVDVAAAHPLPQPGREVGARHAARRIVGPRETGKVRVAEPVGEAGQIGGDSIGECDRRRAEVESLRRHEATLVRFRIRATRSGRAGHDARAALAGPSRESHICWLPLPFWQGFTSRQSQGEGSTGRQPRCGV